MLNSSLLSYCRFAAPVFLFASLVLFIRPAFSGDPPENPYVDNRPIEIIAWRKPITLIFEDGQQQAVLLRRTPPVIIAVTDSIATEYNSLKASAEAGNAYAAYALYKALLHCSISPGTQAETDREIERLRASRQLRIPNYPHFVTLSGDVDLAQFESAIRQSASRCEGVTEDQKGEMQRWLDISMRGGVAWAFKNFAQDLSPAQQYTSEGLQAWDAVWRTGSVAAVGWMATIYRHGISESAAHQPDLLRAYAHQFLYVRLMREKAIASGGRLSNERAAQLEADLVNWAAPLTAGQRQAAASVAREVLIANENCCYLD